MNTWIPTEKVAKVMKPIDINDFKGLTAYIGIDLASTSDLCAMTALIVNEDKFYFKSWGWVPRDTFVNSPNHELYNRFANDGDLIISDGNIAD